MKVVQKFLILSPFQHPFNFEVSVKVLDKLILLFVLWDWRFILFVVIFGFGAVSTLQLLISPWVNEPLVVLLHHHELRFSHHQLFEPEVLPNLLAYKVNVKELVKKKVSGPFVALFVNSEHLVVLIEEAVGEATLKLLQERGSFDLSWDFLRSSLILRLLVVTVLNFLCLILCDYPFVYKFLIHRASVSKDVNWRLSVHFCDQLDNQSLWMQKRNKKQSELHKSEPKPSELAYGVK